MDEVHFKEELVYDKHEGSLVGFVNLGATTSCLIMKHLFHRAMVIALWLHLCWFSWSEDFSLN